LLGVFFLIVAVLATVAIMVTTKITAQSLEARAESQLKNDEAIVTLSFNELEENMARYAQQLASIEVLTEELAEPTISRSMMIYILSDLRRHNMKVHLYKEEPKAEEPSGVLVKRSFLGIRATGLIKSSGGPEQEAWIESVAPIETKKGVEQVVAISFPLTSSHLKEIRQHIGSDITLIFVNGYTISTLTSQVLQNLLQELSLGGAFGKSMGEPSVFVTTSSREPAKTLLSPFRVDLKQEGLLLLTMPMGDIVTAKKTIFFKGLVSTLVILSAASLLYLYLIRRVTKPLVELSAATQEVRRGNLELTVDTTSQDEVGELASSFNAMVQQLKESRDSIEEWGRMLEHRVEARTRELAQARDELQETNLRLTQAMTELKEAQSQIIQTEKLASLGRLVAGVAHEVLNPLNAIDLICQNRLRRAFVEEEEKQDLVGIIEELRRVVKITESLKSFARQSPPELRQISLNNLITDVLHFLQSSYLLDDDEVQVHTDLVEEMPLIQADPDQMRQAFFNIISNARDSMPDGGDLFIRTALANNMAEVSIRDTGQGINSENLTRIFDPFFTTKPEDKGTGLGLSICQGIVESHRGSIWVESQEGQGTTFFVRLPLEQTKESVT
jgi:signal transduction histidine kinase